MLEGTDSEKDSISDPISWARQPITRSPLSWKRKLLFSFPFPSSLLIFVSAEQPNTKCEDCEAHLEDGPGIVEAVTDLDKVTVLELDEVLESEMVEEARLGRSGGSLDRSGSSAAGAPVRTVFVFTDVPWHGELRAGDLPLLEEGTIMEFDLKVSNSADRTKRKHVLGSYVVSRRSLKFSGSRIGKQGMTQYLEWTPVPLKARP